MEPNQKQKILMVHNYYQIPGGEDTVVLNEKRLLEEHGYMVVLYTRHNSELKSMGKLQKIGLPFITIFNPRTYREIKKIIRDEKVEIVHVHNTLNLISPAVYYASVKMKVPVVQTIHNFRFLCPGATFYRDGYICEDCVSKGLGCAIKHKCYRGSRMQTLICVISTWIHRHTGILGKINYIALTEFNKEKLLQLKQIRPEQVFVKPNFVEGENTNGLRIGFIFAGRLDELKGIRVLVAAWKLMGDRAPQLTICGTGPLEDWCKAETKNLNVKMKGFVSNEETMRLIGTSKALILPTLWYEGFPVSILEAYSVGTPVICSNLGNAGAIVEENVTGWKFSPGNAKELALKVINWSNICITVKTVYDEKYTKRENYLQLNNVYKGSLI